MSLSSLLHRLPFTRTRIPSPARPLVPSRRRLAVIAPRSTLRLADPHTRAVLLAVSKRSHTSAAIPFPADVMAQAAGKGEDYYRLSKDFKPIHYDLTIKTDLEAQPPTFEGQVEIDLEVNKDTNVVVLHAHAPLKIKHAAIAASSLKTSQQEEADKIDMDTKLERCSLTFPSKLTTGTKAKLGIRFEGVLERSMMGYYQSRFESDGKKGAYGLTQFEPTAARRAFPCWDEPALKATYQVSLIARNGTVALTNTPVVSTVPTDGTLPSTSLLPGPTSAGKGPKGPSGKGPDKSNDKGASAAESGWFLQKHEPLPKMSTYLVAWANGPFEHRETAMQSPLTGKIVPMRMYATKDVVHQVQLCLDTTKDVIAVYERLYDIPYPLTKLDTLVASEFDAGAMENAGLITCRTSVGLWDPKTSGLASKKVVVSVQSHECAHQWFGNLVTMQWWDELWLNEAFATLMGEVISIQELHPDWNVHADFINTHLGRALSLDARRSSHPIQVPCADPEMINQIFDAISYSKGAAVLKMLSNLVGEKTFIKGVSIYLKKHKFGNASTHDLWNGISEASGLDVAKIMDPWTLKIGFPVITVKETDKGLHVTQHRFLSTGDPKPEEDETLWYVPLQLKTVDKSGKATIDPKAILETRDAVVPLKNASDSVYKLNGETCGVYRVLYPADRLAKLGAEAAKPKSAFSTADRMGLVQDAYVLAASGYGQTSAALDLISQMGQETEYLVWAEVKAATSAIDGTWWEDKAITAALNKFEQSLYGPWADRLGLDHKEGESEDTVELRGKIIGAAAAAELPSTIEEARRRFALYVDQDDDSLINGDLRTIIYKTGVKFGGEKEHQKMLEVFRKPTTPQHKISAATALCSTTKPDLLKRTFAFILDEPKEQDFIYFIRGLSENPAARRDLWQFVKDHLDELTRRFDGNFSLGRLLQTSFNTLTTAKDAKAVEAFFKDKDTSKYSNPLAQGLDTVRANAAWLERDNGKLVAWLKAKSYM